MATPDQLRQQIPEFAHLNDQQLVDAIQQTYYPGLTRDIVAQRMGVAAPAADIPSPGVLGRAKDLALSVGKGIIDVPEAAVGLADIPTGGAIGKFLANDGGAVGFRPAEAKAMLDAGYSPAQKEAMRKVGDARGFIDTAKEIVSNPSTIAQGVAEALPSLGAGAVAARGGMALASAAPRVFGMLANPVVAGAVGQAVQSAGQNVEQGREQSPTGDLTPKQTAVLTASGVVDGLLSLIGGKVASKAGLHDIQTVLTGAEQSPVAARGLTKSVIYGAAQQGLIENLPQSVQNQVAQNYALGRPLDEGVDQAAIMGTLNGALMGGATNAFKHAGTPAPAAEPAAPAPLQLTHDQPSLYAFPDGSVAIGDEARAAYERDRFNRSVAPQPAGAPPAPVTSTDVPGGALPYDPAAGAMFVHPDGTVSYGADAIAARNAPFRPPEPPPGPIEQAAQVVGALPYDRFSGQTFVHADGSVSTGADAIAARNAPFRPRSAGDDLRDAAPPVSGPMSAAANAAIESQARAVDAGVPVAAGPVHPVPDLHEPSPEVAQALLDHAQQRTLQLTEAQKGVKEQVIPPATPEGRPTVMPATEARHLTPGEKLELEYLQTHGGDPTALAHAYGVTSAQDQLIQQRAAARAATEAVPQVGQHVQQSTDIATGAGKPFTHIGAARRAQGRLEAPDAHDVVPVNGGFVIRPHKPTVDVAGKPARVPEPIGTVPGPDGGQRAVFASKADADLYIRAARKGRQNATTMTLEPVELPDGRFTIATSTERKQIRGLAESARQAAATAAARADAPPPPALPGGWRRFGAASGSRMIPRDTMPQVEAVHRGALVNFLRARGIEHTLEKVDPTTLKPTQAEYHPDKVTAAAQHKASGAGERSIIISSDGHVVDGHHQWLATRGMGVADVIRLHAPIEKVLPEVMQFPSAKFPHIERAVEQHGGVHGAEATEKLSKLLATNESVTPERLANELGMNERRTQGTIESLQRQGALGQRQADGSYPVAKTFRGRGDATNDPSAFSRIFHPDEKPTLPLETARAVVSKITRGWKGAPDITVVASHRDVPEANVPEANVPTNAKGLFQTENGKVYVIANQHTSSEDLVSTLVHESLGHLGLRAAFGGKLGDVLDLIARDRPDLMAAKARDYGFDLNSKTNRQQIAEEVLAHLAETQPQHGLVARAVAAVRGWLRSMGLKNLSVSDGEIRSWLMTARHAVERGDAAANARNVGAAWDDTVKTYRESVAAERGAVPADTMFAKGPDGKPIYTHEVYDPKTGEVKGSYQSVTAARRMRDFYDNKYGAYHYSVREIARGEAEPTTTSAFDKDGRLMFRLPDTAQRAADTARDWSVGAGYKAGDFLREGGTPGKLGLWHKLVGTPYHLAQTNKFFKPVFDAGQAFITDAAFHANDAANKARTILPSLDSWKDIVRKQPLSAEDTAALAKPVFEGTLRWTRDDQGKLQPAVLGAPEGRKPGVVFTDDELRAQFNATPRQIDLYHQFRAATDHGLDTAGQSFMTRFAQADISPEVKRQAMAAPTARAARDIVAKYMDDVAQRNPTRAKDVAETKGYLDQAADRVDQLKREGYAPLSRFGHYALDVTDPKSGERVMFRLFESAAERARVARQLASSEEFKGMKFEQGTVSQEKYKLYRQVSPDTIEAFGQILGLQMKGDTESDRAFQTMLKEAVANNSAMKRMIHREGIEGYSEDPGRVLAGFVYSQGRLTSKNLHGSDMDRAIQDIPKGQGELIDHAVHLRDYIHNPQPEAQALRGLLFAQFLGGSVASAMVNATQPFMTTLPYLSQHAGLAGAGKHMADALKLASRASSTGDKVLDEALRVAGERGITAPQEVHQLMAQARGAAHLNAGDGSVTGEALARTHNAFTRLALGWGKVFGVAEQFNRRLTFIAAYNLAREKGISDPAAFAEKAVKETQFLANKGNKPVAGRGAVGATLFTFKQYSVSYLEMVHRMATAGTPGSPERAAGRRAALYAIGALMMMSGVNGLPFISDADDAIDAAMQRLGYNFSSKRAREAFIKGILGDDLGEIVKSGVSGIPGVPIDVSGRLGMANLIPGTGLLVDKADHTNDIMELAGPVGKLAQQAGAGANALSKGDVPGALTAVAPQAVQNVLKAVDMSRTGAYRDQNGKKVIDIDGADIASKALGFQPHDVAQVQEAAYDTQKMVAENQLKRTQLTQAMAQAEFMRDQDAIDKVKSELDDWNEKNPDLKITINRSGIRTMLRAMNMTKNERLAKAAPAGIRQTVREQLSHQ